LAQNLAATATSDLFAKVSTTPAAQSLVRRLENGGVFSCAGIDEAARPFFAALLGLLFPERPIVVVTDLLKTQESFQQDLETWLGLQSTVRIPQPTQPLFYPAWEVLPHENKLPHSDTITDRLQTLVALAAQAMTAALAAGRRSMDWVGVCLPGCIAALGGGTIRDVLS